MDNINFVTSSIVKECHGKSVEVSETLAAFMARARVLEDQKLYHMDKTLSDEDVTALIETCVTRLCERDSPPLKTIQAQVAFEEEYQRQMDAVQRKLNTKDAKLVEIFRDIELVRVKSESDFDALSVLYRKIFNFVMVCTGADQANDRAVERENAAALESVFPRVALSSFVALGIEDKRVQLHELSNIVYGIRLFNREIGKGGAGIVDVNRSLDEEMALLSGQLNGQIAQVEDMLQQYVDVLVYLHHPSRRDESRNSTLARRLQTELVFWRQFQSFQLQILEETKVVGEHVTSTRDAFQLDMSELKDIVGGLTSVPKEKVYPRFDALANMWNIFVEENDKLMLLKAVLTTLDAFRDMPFKPAMRARDVEAARAAGSSTAAPPETAAEGGGTEPEGETVVVPPHLLSDPHVRLEFRGFDPCAIADRDGLLMTGHKAHGLVRHKGKYYSFADAEAVGNFVADPEKVLQAVSEAARATPEVIHLLGLGSSFPSVAIRYMVSQGIDMGDGSLLYKGGIDTRASKEMGCQTDTHVVPSFIDKNYEWNEWALRRRALMLTNLRTKLTHSTQTVDSHFRRENATQHYPPKENKTQTAKSTGTAPRKESNYITGLRGHPDEKMHVVNISLDL
eukprot:SAG31_NODE_2125_length_6396_cov_10.043036_3_plen_624_part_00